MAQSGSRGTLIIVLSILAVVCLCCGGVVGVLGYVGHLGMQLVGPVIEVAQLVETAKRQNTFDLPENDEITQERLDVYLAIREKSVEAFIPSAEAVKEFEGIQQSGRDPGLGEVIDLMNQAYAAPKAWANGLVREGMHPSEYRYITEQVYFVWYRNLPDPAIDPTAFDQRTTRVQYYGERVPDANRELFDANREKIERLVNVDHDAFLSELTKDFR